MWGARVYREAGLWRERDYGLSLIPKFSNRCELSQPAHIAHTEIIITMDISDDAWNLSEASDSPPLASQPSFHGLTLDTSLRSPPKVHLEGSTPSTPSFTTGLIHSSGDVSSTSPTKSLGSSAPILIPQANVRMASLPSMAKAAPADPHTTKQDVESQMLSSSASSSVNDTVTDLIHTKASNSDSAFPEQQTPSTPTQAPGFFNNMFSAAATSLTFNRTRASGDYSVSEGDLTATPLSAASDASGGEKISASPNMLSYRRKGKSRARRNTSLGSVEIPSDSPLVEVEKPYVPEDAFDTTNYVDEKYKGTSYRYATPGRNETFHNLFKSVPAEERLIDDFSCALSREILLQGRIYVSEHNLCFNSNLLGWVTHLVIPFNEIVGFEKTVTAGLFPNGIAVKCKDTVKSFASFMSRDNVLDFFYAVWQASGDQSKDTTTFKKNELMSLNGPLILTKEMNIDEEDPAFVAAQLSIDGDSPTKRKNSESTTSFSSDDEMDEEDESSDSVDGWTEAKTTNQSVFHLKSDSKYHYDGVLAHARTTCPYDPEANNETVLARENLKCPPGVVYELLFGSTTDMLTNFLNTQDSRDISDFSAYAQNDDGNKERHYEYIKGLNFSMGPKQTKCLVKETIDHLDFDKYINVVNTTQTPDVPSGGAFCVKTRYIMTWGANNTTDLVVSYWIHWMGSSWVKGVIEKSTKSGQEAAIKTLIEMVKKTIDDNIEEKIESVEVLKDDTPETVEKVTQAPVITPAKSVPSETLSITWITAISPFNALILVFLSLILYVQLSILQGIQQVTDLTASTANFRSSTGSNILGDNIDYNSVVFDAEEILIWNWIDERAGKLDVPRKEKAQSIQKEIDEVILKWSSGELDTTSGRGLVLDVKRHIEEYAQLAENDKDKSKKAEELRRAIEALL